MVVRRHFSTALVGLGACLIASQVHAVAFTDTRIHDAAGAFVSPSALFSGEGTPRKENINALTGLFAGEAWSLLDRTNKAAESFDDVLFLLSADTGRRSGAWELNWDKPAFSPYMDLILLLKGGKQWGAYLFQAGGISPDIVGEQEGQNAQAALRSCPWLTCRSCMPVSSKLNAGERLCDAAR